MSKQQKNTGESFLAGIEKLVNQILFVSTARSYMRELAATRLTSRASSVSLSVQVERRLPEGLV
jgi:hypothetical protein